MKSAFYALALAGALLPLAGVRASASSHTAATLRTHVEYGIGGRTASTLHIGHRYRLQIDFTRAGSPLPSPFVVFRTTQNLRVVIPSGEAMQTPGAAILPFGRVTGQSTAFFDLILGGSGPARVAVLLYAKRGDSHSFIASATWSGLVR